MPELKYTLRGQVEAEKYLAELAKGAQSFAGTRVSVGTRLPRGLFTDVGTRRGTRATHWLSGLVGQASSMARQVLVEKLRTPLALASALVDVGNRIAASARSRAPKRSGQLRGDINVVVSRGVPGTRLGTR